MKKLKRGDKIGVFSPSSPASITAQKRYERAKRFLESKGFVVIEGILTGKQDGYRSGTPRERAEELNQLLRDPEIKMVMSMIGGTNSNSMLPYIDYAAFKKDPKWVVGYSDATAVLLSLYQKTGVPTYYGPSLVPSFGEFDPLVNDTYYYFKKYFMEEIDFPYAIQMPTVWSDQPVNWLDKKTEKELYQNEWVTVNEGVVEGRLIGGNVNAMYGFIGTEYMPEIHEGDILLLEDTMKNASTVEKNFAMLLNHGIFNKARGIILGKHELYDDSGTGRKPLDILLEILDNRTIPILADFDSCHTHPMIPMPIGKRIRLNTTKKSIHILE